MNIWQKALAARDALNYGEQLTKSATWKQRTNRMNALVGILTALLPFAGIENADPELIKEIASGVSAGWMLWNLYFNTATSTKVGL